MSLSASCFAFANSATSNPNIPDHGVYVQGMAGIGFPIDIFNNPRSFTPVVSAGYQFNRYLAMEARYQYMTYKEFPKRSRLDNSRNTLNQFSANIKGILPLVYNFNVYGTVGLGPSFNREKLSDGSSDSYTRLAVPLGLGLDYNFSKHLAWTVGGNVTLNSQPSTVSVVTGLKYTF